MPTLVLFDERDGMDNLIEKYGMERTFNVIHTTHVKELLGNFSLLNDVKAVFLSGVHSHDRNIVLKECVERKIQCYMIPRIGDVIMSGAMPMHMFHLPMMMVHRYEPNPEYVLAKRLFDILSSGIVLVILSPLLFLTALAIKLQDGGPVFYTQKRLTQDGKVFNVYKFRSMRVDA
ncbi:MAG: sugar transferase, partial [Phascolarctobacterium sp.]|nr:sugar transferase [Candidatus Phascolarctobacterium caballi]